ncbi:MAG: carboxypeptidase regulatory-like domain-containing protein [Elusimicrobiota bacterium]|nr:carboxypeptidase regulatory-like domain-containing protein [Elusimicrobiota bacterium]
MRQRNSRQGGTLTELMVATVILSVGVLGLFGAFKYIARSTFISRATSLATNLGQERIESLKNLSYYSLQITTATGTDATVSPHILYDTVNYPPETIAIGGITFTRYTYVGMADMLGSDITSVAFTYPDTGLKQITVSIVWSEAGNKKSWTLRNLLENPNVNPLDSTIAGTVNNSAGGTVASAIVVVEQNENWGAMSNAAGAYSFAVYRGTYTVRASSTGFTDGIKGSVIASRGGTVTADLTLTAVATGYITGAVWYNPFPVISQVLASSATFVPDGTPIDLEYVELYNPTTSPFNVGTTGAGYKTIMLGYREEDGTFRWDSSSFGSQFFMTQVTTYIAPGHYYLIANASYFYLNGGWMAADAYSDHALGLPLTYPDYIKNNKAGSVFLYYDWEHAYPSPYIDLVGWADNNNAPAGYYEGTYIPNDAASDGLGVPPGKQLVRVSSPGISAADLPNYGRAYDSGSNARDFLYESGSFSGFVYPPKNMAAGAFTTIAGKVPTLLGTTYISASDSNSGSTTAFTAYIASGTIPAPGLPYSRFQLAAVSTGAWIVSAAYAGYSNTYENVVVVQHGYTGVPNATTTPPWPAAGAVHMQLTSTTAAGFVKGTVTNPSNQPINGIVVQGGGATKTTGSNGVYFMAVSSGAVTIIANPNNVNPSYVQGIEAPVIAEGAVTTQDFTLNFGGRIMGYITTGTTPLAYQPVAAIDGAGFQVGTGVTDTSGNFTIRNVSTGTYTVFPVLESGQDMMPNTLPAAVTSTGTVFVGTFTVTGAFGSITGTVSDAAGLVTSGALLLASTNTIATSPAAIVGSSAPAQVPLYMVSSKADGTYVLPVRGGATYYLSAYIPIVSAAGVTVTTKTYSGIVVAPSVATSKNVTLP